MQSNGNSQQSCIMPNQPGNHPIGCTCHPPVRAGGRDVTSLYPPYPSRDPPRQTMSGLGPCFPFCSPACLPSTTFTARTAGAPRPTSTSTQAAALHPRSEAGAPSRRCSPSARRSDPAGGRSGHWPGGPSGGCLALSRNCCGRLCEPGVSGGAGGLALRRAGCRGERPGRRRPRRRWAGVCRRRSVDRLHRCSEGARVVGATMRLDKGFQSRPAVACSTPMPRVPPCAPRFAAVQRHASRSSARGARTLRRAAAHEEVAVSPIVLKFLL